MQRGGRRTHENGASGEIDFIRQRENTALRHGYELRVSAVPMLAYHRRRTTKLFVTLLAKVTNAASCQVVNTYAIAFPDTLNIFSSVFHRTRHFVAKGEGQGVDGRSSRAVMCIR